MKILDKYIAKNFLIGYIISFSVLIGLMVIVDLFSNLDEFAEHKDMGLIAVLGNMASFYGLHSLVYFRDMAGFITFFAAVFSITKMVRNNELVAVMASGVSLKRIIMPIMVLSMFFTGLMVIDQEFVIPPLADKLVRSQDATPGEESYDLYFIDDSKGSKIFTRKFDVETSTMYLPSIIIRQEQPEKKIWEVVGRIEADKAVYNPSTEVWDLVNGKFIEAGFNKTERPVLSYQSDITPKNLPVRRQSKHKDLLSWNQLRQLKAQKSRIRDLPELYAQSQFHITDPIINFVMLMLCLPVLVRRDPKTMKTAILVSFFLSSSCFITTAGCKMMATEAIFQKFIPEFWAWLPIFIFLPIAFIELDSMKT